MPQSPSNDFFATTRWTMVRAAGEKDSPHSAAALEVLWQSYWIPLYGYVRRRGYAKEDAEDLTQGFFAKLLERQDIVGLAESGYSVPNCGCWTDSAGL